MDIKVVIKDGQGNVIHAEPTTAPLWGCYQVPCNEKISVFIYHDKKDYGPFCDIEAAGIDVKPGGFRVYKSKLDCEYGEPKHTFEL